MIAAIDVGEGRPQPAWPARYRITERGENWVLRSTASSSAIDYQSPSSFLFIFFLSSSAISFTLNSWVYKPSPSPQFLLPFLPYTHSFLTVFHPSFHSRFSSHVIETSNYFEILRINNLALPLQSPILFLSTQLPYNSSSLLLLPLFLIRHQYSYSLWSVGHKYLSLPSSFYISPTPNHTSLSSKTYQSHRNYYPSPPLSSFLIHHPRFPFTLILCS